MQNDDHASIKYLMKELDPAEAVLFEQRMMEDEELLLEVECMRRTLRRLEKLPLKNPPSELTEYIVRKACSQNCSSNFHHLWFGDERFSMTKYYAAAALILVGMGIGLVSFQFAEREAPPSNKTQSVSTAKFGETNVLNQDRQLQPWINRNEAIYLEKPSANSPNDGDLLDSTNSNRFRQSPPVSPPFLNHQGPQSSGNVRLTGSHR